MQLLKRCHRLDLHHPRYHHDQPSWMRKVLSSVELPLERLVVAADLRASVDFGCWHGWKFSRNGRDLFLVAFWPVSGWFGNCLDGFQTLLCSLSLLSGNLLSDQRVWFGRGSILYHVFLWAFGRMNHSRFFFWKGGSGTLPQREAVCSPFVYYSLPKSFWQLCK